MSAKPQRDKDIFVVSFLFGCENKPETTCSKVTDADVALFGLKTFTVGQENANKELESYKKLLWNVTEQFQGSKNDIFYFLFFWKNISFVHKNVIIFCKLETAYT